MLVEEAIGQLDVLWQKSALMQRLIDSCLIEGELRGQAVQVTPAEVQSTLDDMRRRRGLFTAAQLKNWLADSGMSLATLQDMALKVARANKLRDVVIGAAAAEYFENHRAAFDRVKVAVLEVANRAKAEEVAAHIRRHAAPLSEIANQLFLMNDVDRTQFAFKCGARHHIEAEFELTDLWPGTVHVVEDQDGCRLLEVLAIEPVKPSSGTLRAVKGKMFQDWLTQRRRSARIEWFWGESQRTSRPAA
jgi:putative peptide maturation system protein